MKNNVNRALAAKKKFILCALTVITLAACKWEYRLNNVQLISPSIPPAYHVGFFCPRSQNL